MMWKWIKRIAIFLSVLLLLVISVFFFLHTPWGKAFVRDKTVNYLEKKLKTKVSIGDVDYRLPDWIRLKQILILDQQHDTLLSGGSLFVRINMIQLLYQNVVVKSLELQNTSLHISRQAGEEDFNYQFISDAFSSTSPPERDSTFKNEPKPINLNVHSILLDHVSISMNDYMAKQYFAAGIQKLSCSPRSFDLKKNIFDLGTLSISGGYVNMVDSTVPQKKTERPLNISASTATGVSFFPVITLSKLEINNVYFSHKIMNDKLFVEARLCSVWADELILDPSKQGLACKDFDLHDSKISLLTWLPNQRSQNHSNGSVSQPAPLPGNFPIEIECLRLRNNSFAYHNKAIQPAKGFDPNHIEAEGINLLSTQTRFDDKGFFSSIDNCSAIVSNRYRLKSLHGNIRFNEHGFQLQDITVLLNNSQLTIKGGLALPASEKSNPVCRLENTELSYQDLLDIQPSLKEFVPVAFPLNEKIKVSGSIKTKGNNLVVEDVQLATKGFRFLGSLTINDPNSNNFSYHTSINQLDMNSNLLSPFLLSSIKKQNLSLPEKFSLSGIVGGNAKDINADVKLNSNYGQAKIKGVVKNLPDIDHVAYDLKINAYGLETGKWIHSEDQFGKMTGTITVKGKGTVFEKMQAVTHARIGSVEINGYTYSNIQLNGNLDGQKFDVNTLVNDTNLLATINASGTITGDGYPSFSGVVSIDRANMKALDFLTDTLNFSGIINIDSLNTDPRHFVAKLNVERAMFYRSGKQVGLDSLELTAHSKKEGSKVVLTGPALFAQLNTSYTLEQASMIEKQLLRIYKQEKIPRGSEGWVSVKASMQQNPLLAVLVPGLELIQPIKVDGKLDATSYVPTLQMEFDAPALRYNKARADSLMINAIATDSGQLFTATAKSVVSKTDSFLHPAIRGIWKDEKLFLSSRIEDNYGKEYCVLKAFVSLGDSETTIQLPEDLVLNYGKWKVSENNLIRIRKDGIIANHFSLTQGRHVISLSSSSPEIVSPLQIKIDSVDLITLTRLASLGDSIATGTLNVDVTVQQPLERFPVFAGKASVYNFGFQNVPIGNFEVNSKSVADSLLMEGKLAGRNEAYFSGTVHPASGAIDLNVAIQKLDMKMLQEFAADYLSRAYGNVSGALHVGGDISKPQYTGIIHIDSTGIALAEINTLYKIDKQQLVLDYPELRFGNFEIIDSDANKLTVNGNVKMLGVTEYGLNLQVKTKNFIALNSKRVPGSSIYGKGIVDADIGVHGSSNEPAITGAIKLLQGSTINYIFSNHKEYSKGNERIRFVNIDTIPMPGGTIAITTDTSKSIKTFKGLAYNVNLEINKDAQFSIVINSSTNDELLVKGEGNLNMGLDKEGEAGITGVYRLQSGYYNMNNQILRGKFLLVKGSTISFNGDPKNAIANIATEYEVKASAQGLLNSSDDDLPGATERIPFMIVLKINGSISKPELSFDIRLKNKLTGNASLQTSVDNELLKLRNDPTELNKQVFSLLVMSQFTLYGSEADFASSNLNADAALRSGMSQFLMEAMNQVADGLIKGVDVNVNFNNYYANDNSSTRTDLGVSLSKNVSDRVTVSIGKNFSMGETVQNNYVKASDQYIPDISTSYKLSKDGRYFIKAYRKTEYDAVVEGYFAETGVSFAIQMDYNRFKELFTPAKKLQNH